MSTLPESPHFLDSFDSDDLDDFPIDLNHLANDDLQTGGGHEAVTHEETSSQLDHQPDMAHTEAVSQEASEEQEQQQGHRAQPSQQSEFRVPFAIRRASPAEATQDGKVGRSGDDLTTYAFSRFHKNGHHALPRN